MDMIILDPTLQARIIRDRRERRGDRYDEVWDGVYVVAPVTDNEHAALVASLTFAIGQAVPEPDLDTILMGANISDQEDDWERNYRCPDVVFFRYGSAAEERDTHYFGGPDLAIEIVSQHDRSRRKFDFYAKVNTCELLIVDRFPWTLELYRLGAAKTLDLVGRSTVERPDVLASQVLPLSFRLVAGEKRPRIAVAHTDGVQSWLA